MAVISLIIFIIAMAYSIVHTKAYRWTMLFVALFPGVVTAAMAGPWSAMIIGGLAMLAACFTEEKCKRTKIIKIVALVMIGLGQLTYLLYAIRHGWVGASLSELSRIYGYSLYLAPEQIFVSLGTLGDIFIVQMAYWYPLVPLAIMLYERRKAPRISIKYRMIGIGIAVLMYLTYLVGSYWVNGPLVIVTNADWVFFYCIKGISAGGIAPILFFVPLLTSKPELTQKNVDRKARKGLPLHFQYAIVALIFGTIFSFVTPLGAEADGNMHYYRTCDVAYGNVLFPFVTLGHNPGIEQVPCDYTEYLITPVEPDATRAGSLKELHKSRQISTIPQAYADPRSYASLFYYPQALGVKIAMKKGLTLDTAGILAHLFNMLAYVIITSIAVAVMPSRKHILAAGMLAPICVFLSASMSSDTLLNAFCFLFIAMVYRLAFGEPRQLGLAQMLPIGIMLLLVYMNKYVYVVLGILVFMIPRERFGSVKKYIRTFIVSLLPLVLYVTWQLIFGDLIPSYNLTDVGETAALAAPGYEGMSQLQFVMNYPIEFIKVIVRTLVDGLSTYFISYNSLGWNNMYLGMLIFVVPMVMLVVAYPKEKHTGYKVRASYRVLPIVAAVLVFFAVIGSIYVFDVVTNGTGNPIVEGIQGRYFVSMVPLLGLAINPPDSEKQSSRSFTYTMIAMSVILAWAVLVYYRHAYLLGY